jgi:hypothetical protein
MSKKKDSFIFYRSFFEALGDLPDENQLELFKAISNFSLNFEEPKLNGISKTIFTLIRPQLAANKAKYKNGCEGGKYGWLGGRPKKNKTPKKPLKNPKLTPNVNENENENEKEDKKTKAKKAMDEMLKAEIEKKLTPKKFKKPSLKQIKDYCNSIVAKINPETFFNHYEAIGWKVGKNPMKDWEAAVRGWNSREKDKANTKPTKTDNIIAKSMEVAQDFINS